MIISYLQIVLVHILFAILPKIGVGPLLAVVVLFFAVAVDAFFFVVVVFFAAVARVAVFFAAEECLVVLLRPVVTLFGDFPSPDPSASVVFLRVVRRAVVPFAFSWSGPASVPRCTATTS